MADVHISLCQTAQHVLSTWEEFVRQLQVESRSHTLWAIGCYFPRPSSRGRFCHCVLWPWPSSVSSHRPSRSWRLRGCLRHSTRNSVWSFFRVLRAACVCVCVTKSRLGFYSYHDHRQLRKHTCSTTLCREFGSAVRSAKWVVVKIVVPFWVPKYTGAVFYSGPEKGPQF